VEDAKIIVTRYMRYTAREYGKQRLVSKKFRDRTDRYVVVVVRFMFEESVVASSKEAVPMESVFDRNDSLIA